MAKLNREVSIVILCILFSFGAGCANTHLTIVAKHVQSDIEVSAQCSFGGETYGTTNNL